jgi:hypothetical protein
MDFKALRAAKNKKAADRINSSGGKVDSSDWTPDEKLDADVKTGMRPISRRAFKTGGKVDGAEAKTNLSRAPRGGLSEKIGLANTDQKAANEQREGKKHVGGFKKGGMAKAGGGAADSGQAGMAKDVKYAPQPTQESMDSAARSNEGASDEGKLAPKTSLRPMPKPDGMKKGGAAKAKYEGSPKDNLTDAKMAKKKGMTHKEWEASPEDKRMDAKGQREMDARGCKGDDCTCPNCRTARKSGGRTKGKTNIVINVMPHTGEKQQPTGITPPMAPPHIAAPAPMAPPPSHIGLPPGLGAAMAGAAGAPMGPPPGGPGAGPMMPPMARKSGGKVYPIHTGAGGGQARLDKIKAYGLKQK